MCTKFEISKLTHYNDMKGEKNAKKLGGLGGQGSPKVIGNITI